MGNTNQSNTHSQLPINFKLIKQQKNYLLGNIQYIVNLHDQNQYILIQRTFVSYLEYQKCLKNVKNRSKFAKLKNKYLPNQYIMQIVDYRTYQYSQFCGKTYKILIFIKKYDSDLKTNFYQHIKQTKLFSQQYLTNLLIKIVNCLIQLYDHNIKPYHLTMQSIVMRNSKIKIIDKQLTNQMSPIDSLNYKAQLRNGTFIAPQMLSNNYQYSFNTSKSDIFTLGILALELATLKFQDQLYDYNQRTINYNKIQAKISKLNYSQSFKLVLRQMVQQCSQQRIGILRLKQTLSKITNNENIQTKYKNLQDSQYNKNLQPNKGLIYLGKHPNSKPNKNIQNDKVTSRIHKQRKDSYHRLLNDKLDSRSKIDQRNKSFSINQLNSRNGLNLKQQIQYRNKKSISFNQNISVASDIRISNLTVHQRKPSQSKNNLRQTPQTNIDITPSNIKINNITPNNIKTNQNNLQDLSDNRSDVPISPISLHKNQNPNLSNMNNLPYMNKNTTITRPQSYNHYKPVQIYPIKNKLTNQYENQFKIQQNYYPHNNYNSIQQNNFISINNNQINNHKLQQNQQSRQFHKWIPNQKDKLDNFKYQINSIPVHNQFYINLDKKTYPAADFKISQFPSFSLPNKPSIQELQTPRIIKNNQVTKQQNKLKTKSFERRQLPQETPIKSLQLIQTQRRLNNKLNTINKELQKQKISGRYDFSNGAVYEGQFNNQNEFQGDGILYFSNGNAFYSGSWKKNQFHGFGILNNIQPFRQGDVRNVVINYKDFNMNDNSLWTQYEGEFHQDKKHGFGTLYFINGDKFSGCFVNDSIEGFGNFYQKNGSKTIMGVWNNNIFKEP